MAEDKDNNDEKYRFSEFQKLPPELQVAILTESPEILRTSYELSRDVQQLIKPEYLRYFCRQPPTKEEIKNNLLMMEHSFALVDSPEIGPTKNLLIPKLGYGSGIWEKQPDNLHYDVIYYIIKYSGSLLILEIKPREKYSTNNAIESISETSRIINNLDVDIISILRTYRQRLSCTKLSDTYAYNETIKRFRNTLDNYRQDTSPGGLLNLYIYLRINAYLLEIVPQVRYLSMSGSLRYSALRMMMPVLSFGAVRMRSETPGHIFYLKNDRTEFDFDSFNDDDKDFFNNIVESVKDLPSQIEEALLAYV